MIICYKKKVSAIVLCTAIFVVNLSAKVITVDNNPGSVAMFDNFADAYNSAEDGDTILLAGSSRSYSAPTIYKRIHVRGPGYYLAENGVEGVNLHDAKVNLRFSSSATFGDSSGSSVRGIECQLSVAEGVSVSVSNCIVNSTGGRFYAAGVQLSDCVFVFSGFTIYSGVFIENSIIRVSINLQEGSSVRNSVVTNAGNLNGDFQSTISDCILMSDSLSRAGFADRFEGSISHCVAIGGNFLPEGFGNVNGQIAQDVFELGDSPDGQYRLVAGSPAIDAGTNGQDIGAFGGASPYRLSGLPNLPRITGLTVDALASDANGLEFEVSGIAVGKVNE